MATRAKKTRGGGDDGDDVVLVVVGSFVSAIPDEIREEGASERACGPASQQPTEKAPFFSFHSSSNVYV